MIQPFPGAAAHCSSEEKELRIQISLSRERRRRKALAELGGGAAQPWVTAPRRLSRLRRPVAWQKGNSGTGGARGARLEPCCPAMDTLCDRRPSHTAATRLQRLLSAYKVGLG